MSENVSSRAFEESGKPSIPANARICEECNNLVTLHDRCPLCREETKPHPDASIKTGYCMKCAEGFPVTELLVIPWEEDPYMQTDDGDLITVCIGCAEKEEER